MIFVDSLNREDKALTHHVLLEVKSVVGSSIWSGEDLRSTSRILLYNENTIIQDR